MQKAALLVGIVFLIVGLAGFIPGLTDFNFFQLAGSGSRALLLGLFQVSVRYSLVHLLFGILGVALARSSSGARGFLIWGGIIYAVLWLYGLIVPGDSAANFVPLNGADNWLHLLLAVGMVLLGLVLGGRRGART